MVLSPLTKPIRLEDLKRAPHQTITLEFRQFFEGFESLVPVEGKVKLVHRGNFLEAEGWAHTIVTLTCHRCLQQFNHRLQIHFTEIVLVESPSAEAEPKELDLDVEDLVESVPPWGEFDSGDWVYQHLYLELPNQLACQPDCQGAQVPASEHPPAVDPRWAVLQSLQQQWEGS